ncbi:hypothetical protein [uncultured Sphingomonas sp.]|nr:hypothetical protein [uncultured Sphingomonas sp.]
MLWTAVSVAGVGKSRDHAMPIENATDATGQPIDNDDIALVRNLIGG